MCLCKQEKKNDQNLKKIINKNQVAVQKPLIETSMEPNQHCRKPVQQNSVWSDSAHCIKITETMSSFSSTMFKIIQANALKELFKVKSICTDRGHHLNMHFCLLKPQRPRRNQELQWKPGRAPFIPLTMEDAAIDCMWLPLSCRHSGFTKGHTCTKYPTMLFNDALMLRLSRADSVVYLLLYFKHNVLKLSAWRSGKRCNWK